MILDALILGAGPAGMATALDAAACGLAVAVVDRSDFTAPRPGEHLGPEAARDLDAAGWRAADHREVSRDVTAICSIWQDRAPVVTPSMFAPMGQGFAIRRPAFERSLHGLARRQGIDLHLAMAVQSIRRERGVWQVELGKGKRLAVRHLVDATGNTRWLSRRLERTRGGPDLLAFHWRFAAPGAGDARTSDMTVLVVEAGRDGWFASLGVPGAAGFEALAVTWFTDRASIRQTALPAWRDAARALGETALTAGRCRDLQVIARQVAPCGSQPGAARGGTDWSAVGDARYALDPLSGQGIGKAVAEGRALAARLAGDAVEPRPDITLQTAARAAAYAAVTDWSDAGFWRRRSGASS